MTDSLASFKDWLDRSLNFERTPTKGVFWLDTMRFFTERLGHPERSPRCLHVAGSKGKGSISMMAACILQEAGYKVGIYTSPHITDFRERISTPDSFFDDWIYEKAAGRLMETVDAVGTADLPGGRLPTWFELVTLFAMLCFEEARVDWVVWEVGLGGRLDSTNVVAPECCLIGPIEKEHCEFLGDTLEKIAGEKAGIIKEAVPVIVAGQQSESVRDVFRKKASEGSSPLLFADEKVAAEVLGYVRDADSARVGMEVCLSSSLFSRPIRAKMRLLGRFQAENAALASLALKKIFPELDEGLMERGLGKARLPGRFEIVAPLPGYAAIPELILDGAHTPRSISLTMESFEKLYGSSKAVLLFACAADKDVEDIAPLFRDCFSSVFLTRPGSGKTADLGRMEAAFSAAGIAHRLDGDYRAMIESAFQAADGAGLPLLVTGSFYLVSAVKEFLSQGNSL